jgi:hypothetical protein
VIAKSFSNDGVRVRKLGLALTHRTCLPGSYAFSAEKPLTVIVEAHFHVLDHKIASAAHESLIEGGLRLGFSQFANATRCVLWFAVGNIPCVVELIEVFAANLESKLAWLLVVVQSLPYIFEDGLACFLSHLISKGLFNN